MCGGWMSECEWVWVCTKVRWVHPKKNTSPCGYQMGRSTPNMFVIHLKRWNTSLGCHREHFIHVLIRTEWAPSACIAPRVFRFICAICACGLFVEHFALPSLPCCPQKCVVPLYMHICESFLCLLWYFVGLDKLCAVGYSCIVVLSHAKTSWCTVSSR